MPLNSTFNYIKKGIAYKMREFTNEDMAAMCRQLVDIAERLQALAESLIELSCDNYTTATGTGLTLE